MNYTKKILTFFPLLIFTLILSTTSSVVSLTSSYVDPTGYPGTWPSFNENRPYTSEGVAIKDLTGNPDPSRKASVSGFLDFGDDLNNTSFFDADGNTLFYRFRLMGSPLSLTGSSRPLTSATYNVLFDTDGDGFKELVVMLQGTGAEGVQPDDMVIVCDVRQTQTWNSTTANAIWRQDSAVTNTPIDHAGDGNGGSGANPIDLCTASSCNMPSPSEWTYSCTGVGTPNAQCAGADHEYVWDFGRIRVIQLDKSKAPNGGNSGAYLLDIQVPVENLDCSNFDGDADTPGIQTGPKLDANTFFSTFATTSASNTDPTQKDGLYNSKLIMCDTCPVPGGDLCNINGVCKEAPVILSVTSTSCPATSLNLTAIVTDSLSTDTDGNVISTLSTVEFFYYEDKNNNNTTDDAGSTWTKIGNATENATILGQWEYSWNVSSIPNAHYLIKAVATDRQTPANKTDSTNQPDLNPTDVHAQLNLTCGTTANVSVTTTDSTSKNTCDNTTVLYQPVNVKNTGAANDTIDITAVSSLGWKVELLSNTGTLLATDTNGDGTWDLPLNTPSSDTDADNKPDTGSIASNASVNYQIRVTVPNGVPASTSNTVTVTGTSSVATAVKSNLALTATVQSCTTVSGFVYNDANKDTTKGAGEDGTGQTLFVKACQGANATNVATVNTTTGAYSMRIFNGSYNLIEDTNSTTSDCNANDPTNWSSSTSNTIAINPSGTALTNQNFGDYFDVSVVPTTTDNTTKNVCAGTTVLYQPINIKNNSANFADTIDLHVNSTQGWKVELLSNTGTLLATDTNGDGTWDSPLNTPASDTNANSKPDTGSIAAQASVNYQLRITIPGGTPVSTSNTTTLTGTSSLDGSITGTLNLITTVQNCSSISGFVYNDANKDGSKGAGEDGTGQTTYVKLCQGGVAQKVATVNTTTGAYSITNVPDGSYTLLEDTNTTTSDCNANDPTNWSSSTSNTININISSNLTNQNFGDYFDVAVTVTTTDSTSKNGCDNSLVIFTPITVKNNSDNFADTIDIHVTSLQGWTVELLSNTGTLLATDTNGDGTWDLPLNTPSSDTDADNKPDTGSIAAQASVNYQLRVTIPNGASPPTTDNISFVVTSSLDNTINSTLALTVAVSSCADVSGFIFKDNNEDGSKGGTENGLGFPMYVKLCQTSVYSDITTADSNTGAYTFLKKPDGAYTLIESDNANSDCTASDATGWASSTPNTINITLTGTNLTNQNFGDYELAMSASKTALPSNPAPGEIVEYTITVNNNGNSNATNVIVTDTIPNFTTYEAGTIILNGVGKTDASDADQANYNSGTEKITVNVGTIAPTSSATVKFKVKVKDFPSGITITNKANVTADQLVDPLEPTSTIYPVESLIFAPNNQTSSVPGGVVYFTHVLETGIPGNVGLTFTTSRNWTYLVFRDVNENSLLDAGDTQYTSPISLGDVYNLNASHSIKLIVKATIPTDEAETAIDVYTLTATLTPTDTNKPQAVKTVSDITTLSGTGGLKLIKSVSPTGAQPPGTNLTYTIKYINDGPFTLQTIVIKDYVPDFTTFVSAGFTTGTGTVATPTVGSRGEITWTVTGSLNSGDFGEVNFVVQIQ